MNKTEYIATLLTKCNKHKFEQYVLSRLWFMLNDDRIKIVTQQCIYINKEDGKYALADIYLPQINMIIEVDEAHHLEQETEDKLREQGIIDTLGADVKRIDCSPKADKDINTQLTELVSIIRNCIIEKEKLNLFIPWECEIEQTADYHKRKEYLSVLNGDYVRNTTEAFKIFDINNVQRHSTAHVPGFNHLVIWCPKEDASEWKNMLSKNGTILKEEYVGQKPDKCSEAPKDSKEKRIVFLKGKDSLGQNNARYVGVFKFDKMDKGAAIWKRITYYCDLRKLFIYDTI